MAHVRIKRLAAGHDQEHGAEHGEAMPAVLHEERHGVARVDGREHDRILNERRNPQRRNDDEPDDHDRPEQAADAVRAMPLNREHRRRG